ncbi:terpenoid cyclases/Protein prenyltransferase [Atractiella rhizophila]|nr:terpenoid cyclases/Protein prenyltransferase [Atractiella rhizophila]
MDAFFSRKHVTFAARCLLLFPSPYQSEDSTQQSLAFFALASLSLLKIEPDSDRCALESIVPEEDRDKYREWIWRLQGSHGGFAGGTSLSIEDAMAGGYPTSHIITSYTSLLSLSILQDDFSRLRRSELLQFVGACQQKDGSFSPYPPTQHWRELGDPRTAYSALAICSMLGSFDGIDTNKAIEFLLSCRNYDGGFGESPGGESHGGYTYCCLAALSILSSLHRLPCPENTLRWLVQRQVTYIDESSPSPSPSESVPPSQSNTQGKDGFQGRVNKDPDACYSFWVTAALSILASFLEIDINSSAGGAVKGKKRMGLIGSDNHTRWLLDCQHSKIGGVAKGPGELPDVYHTYLSIAALSLDGQFDLAELDPVLNVKKGAKLPRDVLTGMNASSFKVAENKDHQRA